MIARITVSGAKVQADDQAFREVCRDVLCTDTLKITHDGESVGMDRLNQLIDQVCGSSGTPKKAAETQEDCHAPSEDNHHVEREGYTHVNGETLSNGHHKKRFAGVKTVA